MPDACASTKMLGDVMRVRGSDKTSAPRMPRAICPSMGPGWFTAGLRMRDHVLRSAVYGVVSCLPEQGTIDGGHGAEHPAHARP